MDGQTILELVGVIGAIAGAWGCFSVRKTDKIMAVLLAIFALCCVLLVSLSIAI